MGGQSRFRAGVQPGEGVVARYGDVAAVIGAGDDAFTDALLRLVSSQHAADPRALVWQVVGLAAAHQPGVPPFALAVGDPRSRRVLVHGAARAVVDGDEFDGSDLWTCRERTYGSHGSVALTVARGPVEASPRTDLRDGVLSGSGLVLEPGEPAAAAPRPTPTPAPSAPPAAPPRPPAPPAPPAPPSVVDLGTAIAGGTHETVHLAERIAALQADDGTRVPLDRDYVFGRDPRQDPAVVRGAASPIQVDDGEQLISRVHAYVSVSGAGVTVRDAGSANGTYVAAPGDEAWRRIGADPVPVSAGQSIRIGLRVYTYLPADGE